MFRVLHFLAPLTPPQNPLTRVLVKLKLRPAAPRDVTVWDLMF
jgi:hypothetical protein